MLKVAWMIPPGYSIGWAARRRIASAIFATASRSRTPGNSTSISSPPVRPTVSPWRTHSRIRAASTASTMSHRVPVRVIDALETVDVTKENADAFAVDARNPQRGLKAFKGLGPVHQPGEFVEPRQLLQSPLKLDLVVDHPKSGDHTVVVSVCVDVGLRATIHPVVTTVG